MLRLPARRIRGALLSHNLKRSTSSSEAGLLTCGQFKATNDSVAISGVKIYQPFPPAGFLGGDQCGARAAEGVEHDLIAARAIPDGIRHQSHRLDRGMYRELSAGAERVDPGVIPDVGPVPARVAKSEGVGMGCRSGLEHKHQLMLASNVLQFGKYGPELLGRERYRALSHRKVPQGRAVI